MARATGAGGIEKRTTPPSLMLFNFDVDGDALKDAHKTFLRAEALPTLRAGGSVSVIGVTDRTGSDAHNLTLSDKRVASTIAFLKEEVPALIVKQAAGLGEAAAAQEGKKDGSTDDRFRAVLVFLTAAPVVTTTKVIEVTAKSFIALIGDRVGSIPGFTVIVLPNSSVPVPVPRQAALRTMAKFTDAQFNENPLTIAKDKRYRLFSSCRFTVVFENKKILAAVPAIPDLDTDVGKEGPLQPDAMIVSPVTVSAKGESFVTFSWTGKGKPHPAAEPGFQQVLSRTSVFIWHIVEGRIDVSSGTPVTTATIKGSQFPTHRVWINDVLSTPEQRQGPFSDLWTPDGADKTKVK